MYKLFNELLDYDCKYPLPSSENDEKLAKLATSAMQLFYLVGRGSGQKAQEYYSLVHKLFCNFSKKISF